MLCPLPPHLLGRTPARTPVGETTGDGQRAIKGVAVTETVLHSGGALYCTHYVFIPIADVFDPFTALGLSSSAAFIALFILGFFGSKKYLWL